MRGIWLRVPKFWSEIVAVALDSPPGSWNVAFCGLQRVRRRLCHLITMKSDINITANPV